MATLNIRCAGCELFVAAELVASGGGVHWLKCPSCGDGSVSTRAEAVYPAVPAGASVKGVPKDVEHAWREARTSHAVAAYTASEIMCRKILMHLAVDVANAQTGKKFVQYVDDLDAAGYITKGLKPVVDKIRARGNIANHDLPASTEADSLTTIAITEHLLRSIYELPGLAAPSPSSESVPIRSGGEFGST